jgi:hypothetical protein
VSISINRVGSGVTLRHWSADSLSFMGGSERPSPALAELADARRLSQVASMLKQIKAPPTPPSERPA